MSDAAATAGSQTIEIGSIIDSRPISTYQWVVVGLCFCVAMVDGFDTQAAAFVAPVVREIMNIGPQGIGNLYSAGLIGLMVGALTFGALADRIGRKPVIILSCLLMGGFSLLAATANSLEQLLVYRFLTGLGLGAAMPNINALTAEYSPSGRRALLMTAMFAGFPVGAILGGLISVELIDGYGWRSVFVFGGVLPLLLTPVLYKVLPESLRYRAARNPHDPEIGKAFSLIDPSFAPRENAVFIVQEEGVAQERSKAPIVDLFTDQRWLGTLLIWLTYFGTLLMMYSLLGWLPTVMSEAGLGVAGGIYTAVAFNFGGVVGGLFAAWLLDRQTGYWVIAVGYGLAAVAGLMIGGLGASLLWALAVIFVSGLTLMGAAFAMNAVTAVFYPTSARSTGLGWGLAIGRIGAIVGPILIGAALSAQWNVGQVFATVASPSIFCAVSIMVLGAIIRRRRARRAGGA